MGQAFEDLLNAHNPDNLVVTGGEPLLQQDNLVVLLERQKQRGRRLEIETNATILPSPAMTGMVDQWNVSPKLANSGEPASRRLVKAILAAYRDNPKAFFKLVVQQPGDVSEVEELIDDLDVSPSRVFLLPEATDDATLHEKNGWLSEICSKRGFRLSPRLHVEKWNGARGR